MSKYNSKKYISQKILDFVECLPKFRGGFIAHLQKVREHQREVSSIGRNDRKAPDDASIDLKMIIMIITFEFEEFKTIHAGIKRLFPKNKKIEDFIKNLKSTENDLYGLQWKVIGTIKKETKTILPGAIVINELPENTNFVQLMYHRIMPSLAAMILSFELDRNISDRLRILQGKDHLDPIIFNSFWPIHKIPYRYSSSLKMGACEPIEDVLSEIQDQLKNWVEANFKWNILKSEKISFLNVYEVKGNPGEIGELKKWIENHRGWLSDYGILIHESNTFYGQDCIYYRENSSGPLAENLVKIDTANNQAMKGFFEFKASFFTVISALYSTTSKYRTILENLRAIGFISLNKINKNLLRKKLKVQELKRLTTLIERFSHELTQSKAWISISISEVGPLQDSTGKDVNLGDMVVKTTAHDIELIKKSAYIIDNGLTNYLSVQSIYVMYRLQRWMFILSIVITIATIIGLLSNLDKLKAVWSMLQSIA